MLTILTLIVLVCLIHLIFAIIRRTLFIRLVLVLVAIINITRLLFDAKSRLLS
jgi:hypothetical protein